MFPQYFKEFKQIVQNTSFLVFLSVCKNFPSLAGKLKCFQILLLLPSNGRSSIAVAILKACTHCTIEVVEQLE